MSTGLRLFLDTLRASSATCLAVFMLVLLVFFMYAVIGRFIRFYSVAFLSWYLGPKFRLLNKSRYKWWFYGACMVALVVIIFVLH